MRWTVVVPGALLPATVAADVLARSATPWLRAVLARAQAEPAIGFDTGGAPHLAWLWQRFGGRGEPVTAPYALQALDQSADRGAQCWHIDPVHFAFARDHLLVMPLEDLPKPDWQALLAETLCATLREFAAGARPHLYGRNWLLTLATPWSLKATALDGAIGQPVHEHWPQGDDAAAWRKLLTEVQTRWHQLQLDQTRDERTVNALWLHGGGAWAPLPAQACTAVVGDDAVLRGWALASGVAAERLHEEGVVPPPRGDVLSIRRELLFAAQFEAWGEWLGRLAQLEGTLRALRDQCFAAGYDELMLVLGGRRQVRKLHLRRGDELRFWRRAPVPPLFAEEAAP